MSSCHARLLHVNYAYKVTVSSNEISNDNIESSRGVRVLTSTVPSSSPFLHSRAFNSSTLLLLSVLLRSKRSQTKSLKVIEGTRAGLYPKFIALAVCRKSSMATWQIDRCPNIAVHRFCLSGRSMSFERAGACFRKNKARNVIVAL